MTQSPLVTAIHPGKILQDKFLKPLGISQYRLAKSINVSARRVNEIIKHNRAVTLDAALRLALFFNMPATFWLKLQSDYELAVSYKLQERLQQEVLPWSANDHLLKQLINDLIKPGANCYE